MTEILHNGFSLRSKTETGQPGTPPLSLQQPDKESMSCPQSSPGGRLLTVLSKVWKNLPPGRSSPVAEGLVGTSQATALQSHFASHLPENLRDETPPPESQSDCVFSDLRHEVKQDRFLSAS